MKFQSELIFDARKIYFFGALIALLYGLSPVVSVWFFDTDAPRLGPYQFYFVICASVLAFVNFPINREFRARLAIHEPLLLLGMAVAASCFVLLQITVYGDFTSAFIVAYTERTGAEFTGGLRYIFYPTTTAFISLVMLLATHLYTRRDRINWLSGTLLIVSVLIFSALGSRNLLLWSLACALALYISKLKYRHIFLLVFSLYLLAVLFAFARNTGLIAYLTNTTERLDGLLTWAYFDPMIHEFGSSYRTFVTISSSYKAEEQLANAPYGQLTSFLVNQLPSFMKPSNFISFTDYISQLFADPGEGIGSSPMTEAYLSGMVSLVSLAFVGAVANWPAYYLRRWPTLNFFTYALAVAVCFNIWRIGSAEILKMFGSSVVALIILARLCAFQVLEFKVFR